VSSSNRKRGRGKLSIDWMVDYSPAVIIAVVRYDLQRRAEYCTVGAGTVPNPMVTTTMLPQRS